MSFLENNSKNNEENFGFAIPQVLILGIGIAVGVSGLMATSILSLTGSKINRQELLAKSSAYSGITKLRALLNDNTQGRLFNYFWLVNNCSDKSSECENTNISNPSNQYWSDDLWCEGEENCNGRQKAPVCHPDENITWDSEKQIVRNLFNDNNYIGDAVFNSKRDFEQSFNIISTKYIGSEDYGINSILVEGLALPKDSNKKSASNKLRVNIQVKGQTSQAGFGFLSVGENNSDKTNSLFLGDLKILPINTAKGSIIWRMNIDDTSNCSNIKELAKGEDSILPSSGNGGIWIQPLSLPKQPRLRNVEDLGILICTSENYEQSDSKCKLDTEGLPEKTYRIYSLFSKGPGSKFEVSTTDENKIILEIMGDIDISNEGQLCHRNGIEACGTGKPENLTILFKQKTKSEDNKLICDRDNFNGGVKIENNIFNDYSFPIDNDRLPGHSFLIDKTNENELEKFGSFIYGPKTTLMSVVSKSQWIQINNEETASNNGTIITSRGTYGYLRNTFGSSIEDKITNLILTSDRKLIPYGNNNEIEIIAIGKKISPLPPEALLRNDINNVFLIFDNQTSNYHLRSFTVEDINRFNNDSMQNSLPGSFAILGPTNIQHDINLGSDLNDNPFVSSLLNAFEIKVKIKEEDFKRNFTGAAWVKNICFDKEGEKTWEFSKTFIDKLISWHGNIYNWGVKYYRGQSIILWDTLRDFNTN